jgi:membrane-bound serine protease (ClpP class)
LLTSPVPVVVYVAPTGAAAASAGCFITLAADVAAMAPATTIGAAHPVALGGVPGGGEAKEGDTMARKLENFSVSYIESIASKRNRNVEWAKSAVRDSASITSEKALETKVIEIIAQDTNDLLRQLNGRMVHDKPLLTSGAQLVRIKMSAPEALFQMIWRPEVMFVLMLIAIYGLIGELTTPGAILPGIVGAIALILALYMSAILPVNVAGLLLIGLAVCLFIVDVFAPTHGILTGGGIISFLVGSLMLFDRRDPLFRLSLGYILPAVVVTAAFFVFVVAKGIRAQNLPVKVGREIMLGKVASALTPIDKNGGKVFVEGEYWNATSDNRVEEGQDVKILAVDGLTLRVEPKR